MDILKLKGKTVIAGKWDAVESLFAYYEQEIEPIFIDDAGLTIELKINGKEVSFSDLIKKMTEDAKKWSFSMARKIIEDRACELREKMDKLSRLADSVEQELVSGVTSIIPEAIVDSDYK